MKKIVHMLLLSGALLLAHEGRAQSRPVAPRRGAVQPKPRQKPVGVMNKDGLTMQGGKVLLTEQGLTTPLAQDRKLLTGTTVTTTGQVTSASGATSQLAEGDYVSLTGRLTTKREMMEADSVRKLVDYDLKHPGKRKELEKAREKADKAKEKADKEKAKTQAKAARG